jgi:hypothetical protein
MPYLFDDPSSPLAALEPARAVLAFDETRPLDHVGYYRLCWSCHVLTCATPVPTDVDNAIRQKLWPSGLPVATALEQARLVLASRAWNTTLLGSRVSRGADGTPWADVALSGHTGEWFTVAAAAYAALAPYRAAEAKAVRAELFAAIERTIAEHVGVFGSLLEARDGIGALRMSTCVAHNFGDLDRVIDLWELPVVDPLRLRHYRLGVTPLDLDGKPRHDGLLFRAGELYKATIGGSSMALENHRHFALRKPRGLRRSPALRVPIGPFFDAWGEAVARELEGDDLDEAIAALTEGWERLPKTVGYGRAIAGLVAAKPELRDAPNVRPTLRDARYKPLLKTPRDRFEAEWNQGALKVLDRLASSR